MPKKKPIPPPAGTDQTPIRENKPKKRKKRFKQGDFVKNVEDESLILIVTKDVEKGMKSFHATCIASNKRTIGEHERFWLLDRFELTNISLLIDNQ